MRMQVVRWPNGEIRFVFDADKVEIVEVTAGGVEVTLSCGKTITVYEVNYSSGLSRDGLVEELMKLWRKPNA